MKLRFYETCNLHVPVFSEYIAQIPIEHLMKQAPPTRKWRIETRGDLIFVHAPYNRQFVELARAMEGEWNKEEDSWGFDKRRRQLVEEMCAYAYDGKRPRKKARDHLEDLSRGVGRCAKGLPRAGWFATRMSVILVGFGMNGMRGAYTARQLLPHAPKPRLGPKPRGIEGREFRPQSPTGEALHQIRAREGLSR